MVCMTQILVCTCECSNGSDGFAPVLSEKSTHFALTCCSSLVKYRNVMATHMDCSSTAKISTSPQVCPVLGPLEESITLAREPTGANAGRRSRHRVCERDVCVVHAWLRGEPGGKGAGFGPAGFVCWLYLKGGASSSFKLQPTTGRLKSFGTARSERGGEAREHRSRP